jgi:hypothetical protein
MKKQSLTGGQLRKQSYCKNKRNFSKKEQSSALTISGLCLLLSINAANLKFQVAKPLFKIQK